MTLEQTTISVVERESFPREWRGNLQRRGTPRQTPLVGGQLADYKPAEPRPRASHREMVAQICDVRLVIKEALIVLHAGQEGGGGGGRQEAL